MTNRTVATIYVTEQENVTDFLNRKLTAVEIAASTVCTFAIFINACVILILLIGPRAFRISTYFFVANLTLANLLSGVVVVVAVFIPIGDKAWERILLKGLAVACFSSSLNTLLIIACDRFLRIKNEELYQKVFCRRNGFLFTFLTWIISLIVFLLGPLLGWSCAEPLCICPRNKMCECDTQHCSQTFPPFSKSYLIVGIIYFYVSIFGMFLFSVLLFASTQQTSGKKNAMCCCCRGTNQFRTYGPFITFHRKREIRLAKSLSILMVLFFISWQPLMTLFIVDIIQQSSSSLASNFDYCLFTTVIYSFINPIVIIARLPRLWKTIRYLNFAMWRRLYRCKCGGNTKDTEENHQTYSQEIIKEDYSSVSCKANTSTFTVIQHSNVSENKSCLSSNSRLQKLSLQTSSLETKRKGKRSKTPDHAHFSANFNAKTGETSKQSVCKSRTGKHFTLNNGALFNRNEIEISLPFNPESKMMWD